MTAGAMMSTIQGGEKSEIGARVRRTMGMAVAFRRKGMPEEDGGEEQQGDGEADGGRKEHLLLGIGGEQGVGDGR